MLLSMKNYIRKADIVLLIVLIITGLAASAFLAMSHTGGDTVIIESDGKLYASYSLFEDRTIVVPAPGSTKSHSDSSHMYTKYNTVVIKNGRVSVTEATCKNQVCVRHSEISRSGESIVCLPNKLMVRIEGGSSEGGGYDSVSS